MSLLRFVTRVLKLVPTRHDLKRFQIAGNRRRPGFEPLGELRLESLDNRLLLTGSLSVVTAANVSSAAHGGSVTYTFNVQFTPGSGGGDPTAADGTSIDVTNNTCTPVNAVTSGGFNVGDANTNNLLESTETWQYNCVFTVPAHSNAETDPISTTAVATGDDSNGDPAAPGVSNTVAVDITHPLGTLAVAKSSNAPTIAHGGTVTYQFDVTYTPGADGAPAKNIAVADSICDSAPVLASGDTNSNSLLESGETWRFTCTHAVSASHTAGEQDPILNTATASGQDFDGDSLANATSNQVSVDVVHGSISGSKFLDIDGDGTRDSDEPNLRGWTINLFRDSNSNNTLEAGTDPQVATAVTDASGAFTFSNLTPGVYFVRETNVAGFTQSTPNPAPIVIAGADNSSGITFGNQPPTTSIIMDPCDDTKTALLIVGTGDDDTINLSRRGNSQVVAKIGNTTLGTFAPTGRIIAYGLGGNDRFQITQSITLPLLIRGGDGNDVIYGANGDDILIGGAGDDRITGRRGRDLLIGGTGADRMLGSRDEDILVAASTDYDNNDEALCAIMAEWTSSRDYATRLTNVRGSGIGPRDNGAFFLSATLGTVDDDNVTDRLAGGGDGLDWLLAKLSDPNADKISGRVPAEIVDAI